MIVRGLIGWFACFQLNVSITCWYFLLLQSVNIHPTLLINEMKVILNICLFYVRDKTIVKQWFLNLHPLQILVPCIAGSASRCQAAVMVERREKPFNIFQKVRKTRCANIVEESVLEKLGFYILSSWNYGWGSAGAILLTQYVAVYSFYTWLSNL